MFGQNSYRLCACRIPRVVFSALLKCSWSCKPAGPNGLLSLHVCDSGLRSATKCLPSQRFYIRLSSGGSSNRRFLAIFIFLVSILLMRRLCSQLFSRVVVAPAGKFENTIAFSRCWVFGPTGKLDPRGVCVNFPPKIATENSSSRWVFGGDFENCTFLHHMFFDAFPGARLCYFHLSVRK